MRWRMSFEWDHLSVGHWRKRIEPGLYLFHLHHYIELDEPLTFRNWLPPLFHLQIALSSSRYGLL